MAYMKIHCGYCNQHWEIYERDDYVGHKARTCPHCRAAVDDQTWITHVIKAFGMMIDANMKLFQDHTGYHRPVFTVDVIADHIFPVDGSQDDE